MQDAIVHLRDAIFLQSKDSQGTEILVNRSLVSNFNHQLSVGIKE